MAHVRNEQMSLVAFLQAGSTSVYAGSWRHPATELRYLDSSYYADLGRLLERGCFDLMFFDDRLAMPGIYGGSVAEAVRYGARPVKLDLSVVLGVVAGATSRIGLGATYSTTYYAPYHVARTFATLDHLSGGRAAWNVVTSVNDNEAQNFGFTQHMSPTQRYDRADEFLEAVTGLWGTWDDDAMILDREAGIFADPAKVRELNYHGSYFDVRGPLTVPKSPQGRPVILQAGSSGRGRDFAARWAELIFTGDPGIEVARKHYADQKKRIAEMGRNPAEVRICPMAYAVVGESEAQAAEREQVFLNDLVHPMSTLILLSELMNYDFSAHQLDDVVTDELVNSTTGIRGLVENIRAHVGGTVRIRDLAIHRATLLQGPRFVGTARQVADQMEEWFTTGACDGFVLAATHLPGAFEDVVRMVVPELQRRGLFRRSYSGETLRDHLGLSRGPAASAPLSPSAVGGSDA